MDTRPASLASSSFSPPAAVVAPDPTEHTEDAHTDGITAGGQVQVPPAAEASVESAGTLPEGNGSGNNPHVMVLEIEEGGVSGGAQAEASDGIVPIPIPTPQESEALRVTAPAVAASGAAAAAVGGANACLPAAAATAAAATATTAESPAASRTICLRTLRANNTQRLSSSFPTPSSSGAAAGAGAPSGLAAWGGGAGGPGGAAAAAVAAVAAAAGGGREMGNSGRGASPPGGVVMGRAGTVAVGTGGGGTAGGVGPSANKVVDLREVKRVRPGPLAAAASTAAASVPRDDSDGFEEEGEGGGKGGPVKIDLSAGKRMIEFQLKLNASEERRETLRVKNERARADAALAEGSQRTLAQINARMEAQRRSRGGVFGGESDQSDGGGSDKSGVFSGYSSAANAIGEDQVRKLAEKHGITISFVDGGEASGIAQVRALARAHGIRIRVLSEGVKNDGAGCAVGEGAAGSGTPTKGAAAQGETVTPPPLLASLRVRNSGVGNPSLIPHAGATAPPKKTAGAAAAAAAAAAASAAAVSASASAATTTTSAGGRAGGVFSGPARMMRRALAASGGSGQSAREPSLVPMYLGDDAFSTLSSGEKKTGSSSGNVGKKMPTVSRAAPSDHHTPPRSSTPPGGKQERAAGTLTNGVRSRTLPVGRSSPSNAEGAGADAARDARGGGVLLSGPASREARSDGHGSSSGRSSSASSNNSDGVCVLGDVSDAEPDSVGRKRRQAPEHNSLDAGGRGDGAIAENKNVVAVAAVARGGGGVTADRGTGHGRGGGGGVGDRLGPRNGGPAQGLQATGGSMGRVESVPMVSSAPKRMRLVGPSGAAISQAPWQPSAPAPAPRSGRQGASGGGAGWKPGNNLFKGAMAGIMGRGKRPAP